jgi:hypothetical protein
MPAAGTLLWKLRRRILPAPRPAIEAIELRGLAGDVAALVERRMRTGLPVGRLDGERSVRLPHPSKPDCEIKIKGCGFKGGPVWFGTLHRSRLRAPVFDYDGRLMADLASGHDAAYLGGASFQQASTELRMGSRLAALGYPVVPCLGYGRILHKGLSSWFSVHEMRRDWGSVAPPHVPIERYIEAKMHLGEVLLELARRHGLIGYAWFVAAPGGPLVLKDLHPFRGCDPVSMSRVSWVMQLFFGLHVAALASVHFARKGGVPESAHAEIRVAVFKPVAPEATAADHVRLSEMLVQPYMLDVPRRFDAAGLQAVLERNPITRGLLAACPSEYERP